MSALNVICPSCGAAIGKQCRAPSAALVSVGHLGKSKKALARMEEAMAAKCAPHASRISAAQQIHRQANKD